MCKMEYNTADNNSHQYIQSLFFLRQRNRHAQIFYQLFFLSYCDLGSQSDSALHYAYITGIIPTAIVKIMSVFPLSTVSPRSLQ